MAPSFDPNGGLTVTPSVTSRRTSVYSDVQSNRIDYDLPLPSVLRNPFKVLDGPPSSSAGHPGLSCYIYFYDIGYFHFNGSFTFYLSVGWGPIHSFVLQYIYNDPFHSFSLRNKGRNYPFGCTESR